MFTDKEGHIETPELPYGTYVIAETTTPEGHVMAKPFIVHISQDGGVLYTDTRKTDSGKKPIRLQKEFATVITKIQRIGKEEFFKSRG